PLLKPLVKEYREAKSPERREFAATVLADYAAENPGLLVNLLLDADPKQFAVLYPVATSGSGVATLLTQEVDRKLPPSAKQEAKGRLAKRQANAAVALLRLGQPAKVWPLLKHSPDPRARSYLIHRLGPCGAEARVIVKRLDEEPDV